ncbi:hypothetical protein H9P43_009117 [Blastocladiella emersonii ATCC 22665]|nr:hypothetical protein H9P43_009117 [Blastocladiella emersonii ATCC 22665]
MRKCMEFDWLSTSSLVRVMNDATLEAVRACWRKWLEHTYFYSGDSTSDPTHFANPTFPGGSRKACSVPLAGFLTDVSRDRIEDSMLDQVHAWTCALTDSFKPKTFASGDVSITFGPFHHVTFVLGDAVLVMEQLFADPKQRLDVIDTSTLMDR